MNKKSWLIVRLCLLIVLLVLVIFGSIFIFNFEYIYDQNIAEQGEATQQVQSFDGVKNIVVDIASLDLSVVETNGDNVTLYDNSTQIDSGFWASDEQNKVYQEGDTLYFMQAEFQELKKFTFKPGINGRIGDIKIEVPKDVSIKYVINNVSGAVLVEAYSQENLEINNVSGSIEIAKGGDNIDINTVSGSTKIYQPFAEINVETVSGSVKAVADETTEEIDINSVSGSLTVELDNVSGYNISLDSMSGKIKDSYNKSGGGKLDINLNSVSGSINLEDWQ